MTIGIVMTVLSVRSFDAQTVRPLYKLALSSFYKKLNLLFDKLYLNFYINSYYSY
jgi:hypothetical protein